MASGRCYARFVARSVIVSAVRTPFGKLGGGLAQYEASVGAGIPIEVGSDTINKVCASSIRAVEMADQMIRAGDHDVIVTGGMESMTNAPYALKKARFGYRLGDGTLIDLMTHDGLTSTFDKRHMVVQSSWRAKTSRDAVDSNRSRRSCRRRTSPTTSRIWHARPRRRGRKRSRKP